VRRATRGKEKESSDSASGNEGKRLTGEKTKRYSERHGERGVGRRKKQEILQAMPLARRQREKETSDTASGTAANTSASERNERYSEPHLRQEVDRSEKQAIQ
jgi:hypothetical protein